jgi:hypothetical protein
MMAEKRRMGEWERGRIGERELLVLLCVNLRISICVSRKLSGLREIFLTNFYRKTITQLLLFDKYFT